MEYKAFEVYCPNGHPADICRKERCQYSNIHNQCQNKKDVKDVIQMFQ